MQTQLAAFIRDTPEGREADAILRKCVHCGFCNATCPTYQLLGDELDGPRGRIYLMKQVLEGAAPTGRTLLHLDRCLTCRACDTTCPSGVEYGRLVDIGRPLVEERVARGPLESAWRRALIAVIPRRALFASLLDRLADIALASLRSQVEAGASEVQLFDSWAGALDPEDYERFVLPSVQKVFDGVADLGVPRIASGVGTAALLAMWARAGADVVSVDSSISLDEARRRVGTSTAVQGNLDPWAVALAPWEIVEAKTREVLASNAGRPGHVFNLGHGVRPETDPDVLQRIVDLVHES